MMMNKTEKAISILEETHKKFHKLLESLTEEDLKRQSVVTKRSIRAVLTHIIIVMETPIPMYLQRARVAKNMPKMFGTKIGHWFSFQLSEHRAKKASLQSLMQDYNSAHKKLVHIINEIQDYEWQLTTNMPTRNEMITVEKVFCLQIPRHFELHADEIRKTLA